MTSPLPISPLPYPKVLLVTEAPLRQNSTGLERTLFNLFDTYPPERFMLYTLADSSGEIVTSPPFDQQVATFCQGRFPLLQNRLGLVVNGMLERINLQLLDWSVPPELEKLQTFAPDVLLICPNSPTALLMGHRLAQQLACPVLVYWMDDWLAISHTRWLSGSVQHYGRTLLERADGWLMISHQLEQDLSHRYGLSPRRSLVVHNPVDLSALPPPDFTPHEGTFKVVYAGSIWPMHYDAVEAIAEAIFELRQDGNDIELILHTPQEFWTQYQGFWQSRQVVSGGQVPYHALQPHLQRADLLLVAASFSPDHAHVTRSSVQTKLTDYMASGRPILSCGPDYGACTHFVKTWDCGLVCTTPDRSSVKALLTQAIQNRVANQALARTAFDVVVQEFDKRPITTRLYQFIRESGWAKPVTQPSGAIAHVPLSA